MHLFFKIILSLTTLLCCQNCGHKPQYPPMEPQGAVVTDPTFNEYIQEFEYHYGKSVANVPIAFAELDKKTAGVCFRMKLDQMVVYAYIKIDKSYWPKMSKLQKKNLIIHELGHCVLQRDHVKSNSVLVCPTSFMHDTVMYDYCLKEHYDEYIKEMFP